MGSYKPYVNDSQGTSLAEIEEETSIDIASSQLASVVHMTSTFGVALLDLPESQFVPSPGLSNIQYTCQHTYKVIPFNKEFGIFPDLY